MAILSAASNHNYSHFSEKDFRDDVSIQLFSVDLPDVNEQFQDFYFKLQGCVDRHAPLKKLTPKEIKLNQKPWINKELNKMINIKNTVNVIMKILKDCIIYFATE